MIKLGKKLTTPTEVSKYYMSIYNFDGYWPIYLEFYNRLDPICRQAFNFTSSKIRE